MSNSGFQASRFKIVTAVCMVGYMWTMHGKSAQVIRISHLSRTGFPFADMILGALDDGTRDVLR